MLGNGDRSFFRMGIKNVCESFHAAAPLWEWSGHAERLQLEASGQVCGNETVTEYVYGHWIWFYRWAVGRRTSPLVIFTAFNPFGSQGCVRGPHQMDTFYEVGEPASVRSPLSFMINKTSGEGGWTLSCSARKVKRARAGVYDEWNFSFWIISRGNSPGLGLNWWTCEFSGSG